MLDRNGSFVIHAYLAAMGLFLLHLCVLARAVLVIQLCHFSVDINSSARMIIHLHMDILQQQQY